MNWKDELKKKEIQYVTNFQGHNAECDTFPTGYILVTDAEKLIESLLKTQREKYYYEIENSTGTKEADYIDKQVNGGS